MFEPKQCLTPFTCPPATLTAHTFGRFFASFDELRSGKVFFLAILFARAADPHVVWLGALVGGRRHSRVNLVMMSALDLAMVMARR